MLSDAILFPQPGQIAVRRIGLREPEAGDVRVAVEYCGISTGTERLLFTGDMPPFPGLGYPLVPGYEAVGQVVETFGDGDLSAGDRVFVPGSNGFVDARGLFGASASQLLAPARRVTRVPESMGADAVLLALAATAHHAIVAADAIPELIIGHGVLGRLSARIAVALGGSPIVWEIEPRRHGGADGYAVCHPSDDERSDYGAILDVSGAGDILDLLIPRLARGGEIVLAGFYKVPLSFAFPPAFMREARIRVAAEWLPADMEAVTRLVAEGRLSLAGLVTHRHGPAKAGEAYRTAFEDVSCLKMILKWGATQ
ncbi:chlorophyll synthesis pathway protein BchC [Aurantimonas endophytica]|uniref:3-hydroxyethyl bacteriochlorophyllide a dehydrogenase n=1 Tax=Aurantimonas endophytica TaxID=1522175 RepID=A0A7W6HB36_9HYPH|nr:chlorophyll synthesis pathway protein BchC [Aurantimonas endophytica]MBB4001916.1 3-hydroxyethyl bacteriochlorophyllide a dehydrogenase [Aurantimonas endophytica]MCO6402451.1 chlorophyll synthesis pathway protein BchC [Aurantimonas endophytica]